MITTNTIYEIHNAKLDTLISEVKQELALLFPSNKFYKDYFAKNRDKYKSRIDYDLLYKGLHEQIELVLDNSDKYFNIQIKNYNEHSKLYFAKQEEIELLQKQKINENVFVFVLKRFNYLLMKAIVEDGYHFYSLFLGRIRVKVVERTKAEINWGVSLKAKAKLIEQNLIPFIKADADKAKENNEEYKGVQWLENLPNITTYFHWDLEATQYIRIPNIKNFSFDPVRGVASPVVLLRRFEETLTKEELYNKYKPVKDAN